MKWSLNLGKAFGIRILVHWTFLILIGWVVFTEINKGSSTNTIILTVLFVLTIFVCVVLHELGHALMARRFKIDTKKITLLPIGGVASLERMPEEPKKELLIAVAGPAVNVVISLLLFAFVPVERIFTGEEVLDQITPATFLPLLFVVNIALVVFNAIPAFPMDGGRVLRALLAFKIERVKATKIAANLGQLLAIGFVFLGLLGNPFLILIGIFIFFGAYSENMMVQHLEFLKGYIVRDAMMTNIIILHPYDTIRNVVDHLLAGSEQDFIVQEDGRIVGILSRSALIAAIKEVGMEARVNQVMEKKFETLDINERLPGIYAKIQKKRGGFFPVTDEGQLVGAINQENINEFVMVQSAIH